MATEIVQRYDLGEVVGIGAAGIIYRAVDKESGEVVALKKLNAQAAADSMIRGRFRREINLLQRLRHPNIISLKSTGSGHDELFYTMELVNGGTVKSLLDSGGLLPWEVVVDLGVQLCSALQCAHNNGVIHRDLKPGNFFLTREGELKLGDFGIARDLSSRDLTEKGQTVGTHAYMAPEQIRGEATVSDKADLYALGCCLFEMLVCRKVFRADSQRELQDDHLNSLPPRVRDLRPDCPAELDELINQLLNKSPEDRPFNARQVQAKLLQILHDHASELLAQSQPADDAETKTTDREEIQSIHEQSRELLVQRILNPHLGAPQEAVSWARLAVLAAIVLTLAGAAFLFKA